MRHTLKVIFVLALTLVAAACVPKASLNRAALKVESEWKAENDRFLENKGHRFFKATKQHGFTAAQESASKLGMVVEQQDFSTGFLFITSPAPVPLTMEEWAIVQKNDTKEMRSLASENVGIFSWWITLDPSGKDVLSNVFIKESDQGIDVSLSLRLRVRSSTSDKLKRIQPPPSAVRMGVEKFWAVFEKELEAVIAKEPSRETVPAAPAAVQPLVSASKKMPSSNRTLDFRAEDAIAVVIGNKTYTGKVPSVDFAHNDAEAMKSFFVEVLGLKAANIIDLRDARLSDMEMVLGNARIHKGKLWQWVRPGESDVFIYYSGHGVPGLKDGREYLLPVDGDPNAPELKGYPAQLLYENLSKLEARSVTVILDACFSGESPSGALVRDASGIRVTPKDTVSEGITVIAAAQQNQIASWDKQAQHGLFTKHLINGLSGAADNDRYGKADNRVTLDEIHGYLDREMTYAARREYGRDQKAMVFGDPMKVIVSLGK